MQLTETTQSAKDIKPVVFWLKRNGQTKVCHHPSAKIYALPPTTTLHQPKYNQRYPPIAKIHQPPFTTTYRQPKLLLYEAHL